MIARWLSLVLLVPALGAQRPQPLPVTAAEASAFTRTSTLAEVRAFLEALPVAVSTFGTSGEGRDLLLVHLPAAAAEARGGEDPLRVLVVANIHGGEVCGKEAVQILLRELTAGEHAGVRAGCELYFVPIYNVDGNEKLAKTNRTNVNGPTSGLGERHNAAGLDLNRDCIKARSPEFRALLTLIDRIDPHVLLDLHTTNGSPHGYHLTYAPSLSTNVDPDLDRYARGGLLPAVRAAVAERHGYRIFDYGNFTRGEPRAYATFDHRPRFLTNYFGLRNRLSLLSEAYAYEPFEVRVRVTRAFVIESLLALAADRGKVRALCEQADRRCVDGDRELRFHWDTVPIEGDEMDVLVGVWDEVPSEGRGPRRLRRSEVRIERMRVQNAFLSRAHARLPAGGWAIIAPTEPVLDVLRAHGLELHVLEAPWSGPAEEFVPVSGDKARRPYEGVRTIELRGEWRREDRSLPAGTLFVPSHQRLARVAAQLLEPQSEDGLVTWAFFEEQTEFASADTGGKEFPVLRVLSADGLPRR